MQIEWSLDNANDNGFERNDKRSLIKSFKSGPSTMQHCLDPR